MSSSNPDGPTRPVTTWISEVVEEADDPVTPAFERLRHVLDRLVEVEASGEARAVVMMLDAKDLGAWYEIEHKYIELMARAGAWLVLDVYNSDD